jgi:hypothetical protein
MFKFLLEAMLYIYIIFVPRSCLNHAKDEINIVDILYHRIN